MRKKVLIVDDERDARLLLRQYLAAFPDLEVAAECDNGIDAVAAIDRLRPDLVFLDIKMPGLSGFQVAQQAVHVPQIIFTTAYDRFALQAFEADAVDYLLKPYTAERFRKALSKIAARGAGPASAFLDHILLAQGPRYVRVATGDIVYIEAEKDYARIHFNGRNLLSNYGIGVLSRRLNPAQFLRIHRSYLVNVAHIREVYRDGGTAQVCVGNGDLLNVGRTYMEELRRMLF
ncbi:MAG: response regulator [Chitinophagaceae bacterium]|nr:MAG: response regulator [Chitinophagaceae bacterium]